MIIVKIKLLMNYFKINSKSFKHLYEIKICRHILMVILFANFTCISLNANSLSTKTKVDDCYYSKLQKIYLNTNKNTYISGEEIYINGYVLNASNIPDTTCKIAYIEFVNASNQKIYTSSINLKNSIINSKITLPDTLSTGYYWLKAFTNQMRNFDHKYFFSTKIIIANQSDEQLEKLISSENIPNIFENINITKTNGINDESLKNDDEETKMNKSIVIQCNNKIFKQRQKVVIKISLKNTILKGNILNLSLNVSQKKIDELQNLTIPIEQYLKKTPNIISPTSKSVLNYLPENKFKIISGYIYSKSGIPIINRYVYLSTIDTLANLKYCMTDLNGRYFFELEKFYDNKPIILQIKDENQESIKIEDDDKYNGELPYRTSYEYIPFNIKALLKNSQKITLANKINKTFNIESVNSVKIEPYTVINNFYGNPNITIYPADYDEMIDFKEMTRNILPYVYWNNNKNIASVLDFEKNKIPNNEAFTLLNNIPFPDPAFISKLGTKQIKKVELKTNYIVYGDLNLYGILSLTTNQKNIIAFNKAYANITIPNQVSDKIFTQKGPDYETNNNKIDVSDLRQTLYWNPDIKLNTGSSTIVEFYTSDLQTEYSAELKGICSNGTIISNNITISVIQ